MVTLWIILLFVLIGVFISLIARTKTNQPTRERGEDVSALEVSHEEFYKILNFMLLYGIIDFTEYTKIELKSLPYVR